MFVSKVHFMLVAVEAASHSKPRPQYRYLYVERFPCPDDMNFNNLEFVVGDCRIEINDSEVLYCLDTDSWRVAARCSVYNRKGEEVTGNDLVRTGEWETIDDKKLSAALSESFFRASNFT